MSVTIVTFANLGRKQNLKTPDILPVILELEKHNELLQVICQINTQFTFKGTVQATPSIIRRALRLVERVANKSFPRRISEGLFDYFAQRKIVVPDVCILHGGYFLPRTFRKAKKEGAVLIDLAVVAHLQINTLLEKSELLHLGIPGFKGTYEQLAGEVTHDNNFDYVIALSDFVKQSYAESRFPAEKIYVAHPDVDTSRFKPSERRQEQGVFRVLYLAYTTPLKGLGYLLDAWDSLSLPHAELIIVGGYGYMPRLLKDRYAAQIKKSENIVWADGDMNPELQYQRASVFVFPSLTEGFGRVTLEAMACGIPVITTENARGIVEDGKTGFVVPIRDPGALAEKIQYLYDNREIARSMGVAARKAVENKKPFGEAVFEIYQDILRREGKV